MNEKQHIVALNGHDINRIVEMAWEDRTPFDAIESHYGLNEAAVIKLMQGELRSRAFQRWRARVSGRRTKHVKLRNADVTRAYCPTQYKLKSK